MQQVAFFCTCLPLVLVHPFKLPRYVFAVIFTQAVSDYRVDIYANGAELPALIDTAGDLYFGALHQSMLSLFMSACSVFGKFCLTGFLLGLS